jgi:CubicO group peptidase (beta-lactamase class C family)
VNGRGSSRSRLCRAVGVVVAVTLMVVAGCTSPSHSGRNATAKSAPAAALDNEVAAYLQLYSSSVRAVLATVDGRPVLQRYSQTTPAQTRDVHSVTKSVLSTLIGIALAEGRLRSVEQTLGELLPQYRARMTSGVAGITLRQLLTMTGGLPNSWGAADDFFAAAADWVGAIVRYGSDQPGREFVYSNASAHLVAAILARATGGSVLAYARAKLFDPLGIDTRSAAEPVAVPSNRPSYDRADFAWPTDPQGVHTGAFLLKMAPQDLLKIGQLYLDHGRWQGRQLVPASWVTAATTAQVPADNLESGGHYGYLWWVTTAAGDPAYAAVGSGGQLIEVVPRRHLVVVVSSDVDQSKPNGVVDERTLISMVSTVIAPATPRR